VSGLERVSVVVACGALVFLVSGALSRDWTQVMIMGLLIISQLLLLWDRRRRRSKSV
jgi:hypothetical protein